MKNILLICLFLIILKPAYTQNTFALPQALLQQVQLASGGTSGDYCSKVIATGDGGYFIAGYSYSGKSGNKKENLQGTANDDYWVIKLNAFGQMQWQNDIGGFAFDEVYDAKQTSDGGYILAGTSNSKKTGDKTEGTIGTLGYFDYWIIKLYADGTIEWQNTIGSEKDDAATSIIQTSDGGYMVAGHSWGSASGDKTQDNNGSFTYDYWLVKLTADGNISWDKSYGGQGEDHVSSIYQTADGGYIIGGISDSDPYGNKTAPKYGYTDYWVVKTDNAGNIIWQKSYGGSGEELMGYTAPTKDGGYIIAGSSSSNISGNKTQAINGYYDYWVIKINATGTIQWQKDFGGNEHNMATVVRQTKDNGFIIGGYSTSPVSGNKTLPSYNSEDYWLLKTDNSGNIQWQKDYGGYGMDLCGDIIQTKDLGYVIAGTSSSGQDGNKSVQGWGQFDYWVLKLDASGNVQVITDKMQAASGEIERKNLLVSPNPATDLIYLQLEEDAYLNITDVNGIIMYTSFYKAGNIKIPVNNLKSGVYVISNTKNNRSAFFKKE